MKQIIRITATVLCIIIALSVFLCVPVSAAVAQRAYVNGNNVNIRAAATTSSTSLGKISKDYITVTGRSGEWFSMTYNGISGYMHANYVDFVPTAMTSQQGYVNYTGVRLREQPSTIRTILAELTYVNVTVIGIVYTGETYPWYHVTYNGITGYMYGEYIDLKEDEPEYVPDPDFETQLSAFPESYRPYLRTLHAKYPNWIFRADNLAMSFDEAVKGEDVFPLKLVNLAGDGVSWRSMGSGSYNWSTGAWTNTSGGWTGASTEVIKYYMDPRNFLNQNDIYMFLQQGYDSSQTAAGVEAIIKNTFLANGYSDPNDTAYGGSYVKVILEAARQSGVSAYVLASTIILEQGTSGSSGLISGTTGYGKYYNFFNIKASGTTSAEVLANGLNYAKSQGWTTRSAAIIGGAKFYATGYINAGQDTYFYKDFDLLDVPYYGHQYAQSIYDAHSSGRLIRASYSSNTEAPLIFRIPVYKSIPETVAEKPAENNKRNNYYLLSASINGFSMYKYNYSFSVIGDTVVAVTLPSGASLVSNAPYKLTKGTNQIEVAVRAETGYTNSYYLTVTADRDSYLCVSPCGSNHKFTAKNNHYLKNAATCNDAAVYYYECAVCGLKGTNEYTSGNANGHMFSDEYTVDIKNSHYKAGSSSRHCLNCDERTDITVIPPTISVSANTLVSVRQQLLIIDRGINIDANDDGFVNMLDYILLKKEVEENSGKIDEKDLSDIKKYFFAVNEGVNADANEDGTVNILDLIYLKKMLVNA